MRRFFWGWIFLASSLLFPASSTAQVTTVSATIADPTGIPWVGATIKAQLTAPAATVTVSNAAQCAAGGFGASPCQVPIQGTFGPVTLDTNGSFTMNLYDVTLVRPVNQQWVFTASISPGIPPPEGTGPQQFTFTSTGTLISGASVSITSNLSPLVPKLSNAAGAGGSTILNANSLIASGLVADYRFLSGSGTTVVDSAGGNNAAFCAGGQAPTWLSPGPGIQFTTYVSNPCVRLPTSLNAILGAAGGATIQILFQFDGGDGSTANYFNAYYCLLCSNGNGLTANAGGIVLFQTTGNVTANDTAYNVNGLSTNGSSVSTPTWADTQTMWAGTGVLTYVSNPAGQDQIYINGKLITPGNFAAGFDFASNCPCNGNFFLGMPTTGFVFAVHGPAARFYRLAIYNRQLSAGEIQQNTLTMDYFMGQTSAIPTLPCCMGAISPNTSVNSNNQVVLFTDSIFGSNGTTWYNNVIFNNGPWNFVDAANSGNTGANFVASTPYASDALLRPNGGRNVMYFCYGNDMVANLTGAQTFQIVQMVGVRSLSAGWTPEFCTIPTRGTAGFDARRDAFNALLRSSCPNIVWCPILLDLAADLNLGPDGNSVNVTYFSDGTHLTPTSLINNVSLVIGRGTNRWFGNKTWSSANTYTASGTNTIATTAGSEATNTVTLTTAAVGPCVAGSEVTVAGVTPAGYNGQWYILTSNATQITYYDFNAALGVVTVQGTIHCAQQLDADDHLILGGAAAGPIFYLESCIGQVQPTFLLITNTNASPWVLTPWTASETINGAATMNAPIASATNHPVVELDPIFSGSVTAGCTWQAHIQ